MNISCVINAILKADFCRVGHHAVIVMPTYSLIKEEDVKPVIKPFQAAQLASLIRSLY